MKFTTNDLTSMWDMDVLHNKIDGIYDQIQKNITVLINKLNYFPTVDEVNTVLKDYSLKNENEELKTKIHSLETRLAALENGSQGLSKGYLSSYFTKAELYIVE